MKTKFLFAFIVVLACLSIFKCENDFNVDDYLENPYRVLRIPPWSSFSDIKKRYMELVKKYHPDKNKDNDSETKDKFMNVQKAYETLKKNRKTTNEEDDAEDPFFQAIFDTIQYSGIFIFGGALTYFVFWISFKIFEKLWVMMIYIGIPLIIIDKLFPHYFRTMNAQYTTSFSISFFFYFRKQIYNFFRYFFTSKEKTQ